ncbi:hypothetical protein KI387_019646 [Taxus chinensis]|uniref:Armadillo repeat-containing protein n=1 Tax=Taxus chinensis TaxID=29808 RepID=A0AA38G7J2_TAXCH|nr:hypothetical protein KI387_019646 [Taxus chinensis]
MEGKNRKVQISQAAFDALVQENINDFEMDPKEAVEDAIQTFKLQGADLTGIVTSIVGGESINSHPVIQSLNQLRAVTSNLGSLSLQELSSVTLSFSQQANKEENKNSTLTKISEALDALCLVCSSDGPDNASIAVKNGGIELVTSICTTYKDCGEGALLSSLKTLSLLLRDVLSTELFRQSGGPKILMEILDVYNLNNNIMERACAVVAAAATGNEVVKDAFMEMKIDDLLMKLLKRKETNNIKSVYDVIRVLVTADDDRVAASQAYTHARRFADIGMAEVLLDAVRQDSLVSSSLTSLCITLKSVAVNDEICKSIAENGGLDVVFKRIDESIEQNNKVLAKTSCSLLTQLAGSDANKDAFVLKGGITKIIRLASIYIEDPSVLQETMATIRAVSLRSPANAAKAVEAWAVDLAAEAMQKHPSAHLMQKQACLMIRNLAVRNPENRPLILEKGLENLIRIAKANHEGCKDAAISALRDLGLDDYNLSLPFEWSCMPFCAVSNYWNDCNIRNTGSIELNAGCIRDPLEEIEEKELFLNTHDVHFRWRKEEEGEQEDFVECSDPNFFVYLELVAIIGDYIDEAPRLSLETESNQMELQRVEEEEIEPVKSMFEAE